MQVIDIIFLIIGIGFNGAKCITPVSLKMKPSYTNPIAHDFIISMGRA